MCDRDDNDESPTIDHLSFNPSDVKGKSIFVYYLDEQSDIYFDTADEHRHSNRGYSNSGVHWMKVEHRQPAWAYMWIGVGLIVICLVLLTICLINGDIVNAIILGALFVILVFIANINRRYARRNP